MVPGSYAPSRQSPLTQNPMSNTYSSYTASPAPQFNPVNVSRGFSHPPTTNPENMYGGPQAPSVPTSQPRASPYDGSGAFQYVPQQQHTFASPIEGVGYQFGGTPASAYPQQTTPPTTYPQPQQQMSPNPSAYTQPRSTPPTSYPQTQQAARMSPPSAPYAQRSTPPTSYPQQSQMTPPSSSYGQQPQARMTGQMSMPYGQTGQMQEYNPQGSADAALYAQQQQQQTFNFSQR